MSLSPWLRHALLYGLLAGLGLASLRAAEVRWLVLEHSVQLYGAFIAVLFVLIGIWLGRRMSRGTTRVIIREVPTPSAELRPFARDEAALAQTGLTPRELEILELMAQGLSNREIAERAHVSENTVKTHASRVLDKLGARRRTQAVQRGQALRLIP